MYSNNYKIFGCVLLGSAVLFGCSKNEPAPTASQSSEAKNEVKTVNLESGSTSYSCTGTIRSILKDETVKLKANNQEEAENKARDHLSPKGYSGISCVVNTLDTGSSKATKVAIGEYKKIQSNAELIYLYYAKANEPISYEEIAKIHFSDYANQSDVFKKKEVLERVKPIIDQNIQSQKNNNYVWVDMEMSLEHFDMKSERFNIHDYSFGDGSYFYFTDGDNKYKVLMNGNNGLLSLKPKSIDDAKEIESSFKGEYKRVSVRFYGQVMKAAEMKQSKYVVVDITGLEVVDIGTSGRPTSKVLLSSME